MHTPSAGIDVQAWKDVPLTSFHADSDQEPLSNLWGQFERFGGAGSSNVRAALEQEWFEYRQPDSGTRFIRKLLDLLRQKNQANADFEKRLLGTEDTFILARYADAAELDSLNMLGAVLMILRDALTGKSAWRTFLEEAIAWKENSATASPKWEAIVAAMRARKDVDDAMVFANDFRAP